MELAKVTNENLIAGLLLRYSKFNNCDLEVYREILLEKYGYRLSPFAIDIKGIMGCMLNISNSYYMIDTPDTCKILRDKQGNMISSIIEEIDLEEVVLRKINKLGSVTDYVVPSLFRDEEIDVIDKLLEDMSLVYVWSDNPDNSEEMELQVTSIGRERLEAIKEESKELNKRRLMKY